VVADFNAVVGRLMSVAALPAAGMLIHVDGLSKRYPSRGRPVEALRDVSFAVGEGELVTIVGPSGSGKSTLLKLLAGILPPTAGTMLLRDSPIHGPRHDIGMVFQQPVLLPWRSVLRNVLLPVDIQGLPRARYVKRAHALLHQVGLDGFVDKYPHELSGGMQQRVGITRALVHDPAILLMDEPFGALDAMTREYLNLELLRLWADSRKTILFVTHSIPEAVFLADRVIVLSRRPGRIMEIIPVPLPRPRALDLMATPEFGALTRRIRAHFGVLGDLG
jgi:NitT/TauT family transport system ATP-binding protein